MALGEDAAQASIDLKPLSWEILQFLYDHSPIRAETAAIEMDKKVRAVDAAITKSLVRRGFVIREYTLSKVLKREHSELKITPQGKRHVEWRRKKEAEIS